MAGPRLSLALIVLVGITACAQERSGEDEKADGNTGEAVETRDSRTRTGGSETMPAEGELVEGRDWIAHDLEARARAAANVDPIRSEMTPPLPSSWPEAGDRIVYYVYRSRSLATGVDRTSYGGPTHRVELRRGSDEPRVTAFETVADLGSQVAAGDWPEDFDRRMERAAQALLDYLAAAAEDTASSAPRNPDASDEVWEPYRTWFRNRSLITEDLRSRHPAFLEWILGPAD